MSIKSIRELEIGKVVGWGQGVTVDLARKMITMLPISQPEKIVEIPNEDVPSDEVLDLRRTSY